MAVANARSVKIWVMACSLYSSQRDRSTTKNTDTAYHTSATLTNSRIDTLVGVRLTIKSSTASRNEMMMTRAFTSQASHDRSLNLLPICISLATRSPQLVASLSCHLRDHGEHRQI